jgi:UDP-4-amino-4,6-dideoxy-N-acetyl-beta-L-altrosamine transaminase
MSIAISMFPTTPENARPIPYGRQDIDDADIAAVVTVLRSDYLTQGPAVGAFEAAVAKVSGARHAVAVGNATQGLHIACVAAGLGAGDLLWTSPISFLASANCARYCGADVDFVDIDPDTYNMSPDALAAKLEAAEKAGRLPKVVVPVHLAGEPCAMDRIHALSRRYGFAVIEDAAHAIGARQGQAPIGSGPSLMSVFSFHPVKIVTTGEGGAVVTNDDAIARRLRRLASHAMTRDPAEMDGPSDGPWYYQQTELGFNYRMTDIQAALGVSQLKRIDSFIARRHDIAAAYDADFANLPVAPQRRDPANRSALHLYILRLHEGAAKLGHREAHERLRADGILVNLHYIPIYLQPYYRKLGFLPGHCPEAERYYREAISLPIFATLSEAERRRVVEAVRKHCA